MPFNDYHEQDGDVVARLEIDLPDDAESRVKDLVDTTDELQTNLEATTRFTSDYSERIQAVTEAQEQLNEAKERGVDIIERESEAREKADNKSASQREELEKKTEKELEKLENSQKRIQRLENSLRDPGLDDSLKATVRERIGIEQSTQTPEALFSLAQERGLIKTELREGEVKNSYKGTDFWDVFEDERKSAQLRDELSEKMKAERRDPDYAGSATSAAGLLSAGVDIASARSIEQGARGVQSGVGAAAGIGGLGGLAKAVPYIGAGVAGIGAINKGIEVYAEDSAVGQIQGGGFQEGLDARMDALKMSALNPFISNDQSRQIIMTALKGGYSGEEYEDVTEFMKSNLEDMNMSISDSMKIMKTNVEDGGQSLESLNLQLASLNDISGETGLSTEQLTKSFELISNSLVDVGASGEAAGGVGLLGGSAFTEGALKGERGGEVINTLLTSRNIQSKIASSRGQGERPDEAIANLSEEGPEAVDKELSAIIKEWSDQAQGDPYRFRDIAAAYGVQLTIPEVEQLMETTEGDGTILRESIERDEKENNKLLKEEKKGFWEGLNDRRKSFTQEGHAREEARRAADRQGGSKEERGKAYKEAYDRALEERGSDIYGEGEFGSSGTKYEALDRLAENYGNNSMDVILNNGERVSLAEARKTEGLDLKDAKFVAKGGDASEALTYAEVRNKGLAEEAKEGETNVKIDLTDDAKKLIKVDSIKDGRTPHKEKSWAGAEGARPNDAPVGEK